MASLDVNIAAYVLAPFTNPCIMDHVCHHPGVEAQLINVTLSWLGFRTRFTLYPSEPEATAAVVNGSADVVSVLGPAKEGWAPNASLHSTPALLSEKPVFFLAKLGSATKNLFNAADYQIWLLFAATFAAFYVLEEVLGRVHKALKFQPQRLMEIGKTSWFLVLGILLSVYANFLAISLSTDAPPVHPFTDLASLAAEVRALRLRVVTEEANYHIGSTFRELLAPSRPSSAVERALAAASAANPPLLLASQSAVGAAVRDAPRDAPLVGVVWESASELFGEEFCNLAKVELAEVVPEPFAFRFGRRSAIGPALTAYFEKGSALDYYDRQMKTYGFHERMRGKLNCVKQARTAVDPISTTQIVAVFYALALCSAISITAFALERLVPWLVQSRCWPKGAAKRFRFWRQQSLWLSAHDQDDIVKVLSMGDTERVRTPRPRAAKKRTAEDEAHWTNVPPVH